MEPPEQVVERELALWRMGQLYPDIMNGESLAEAERRKAFMADLADAARIWHDRLTEIQRQADDENRRIMGDLEDRARDKWSKSIDYMQYCFPRIGWLDLWYALWNR